LLTERGVEVREHETDQVIESGSVDVGKRLRPNRRQGRDVLFARRDTQTAYDNRFLAIKLP
jgi:hypothetical protein